MSGRFERSRQRLDCLLHGHRDLSHAAAYGEVLAGSTNKELHYCGACGSAVWVAVPHGDGKPRTWAHTGLQDP